MTVRVQISGGPSTEVAWTQGMTVQDALELAEDNLTDSLSSLSSTTAANWAT